MATLPPAHVFKLNVQKTFAHHAAKQTSSSSATAAWKWATTWKQLLMLFVLAAASVVSVLFLISSSLTPLVASRSFMLTTADAPSSSDFTTAQHDHVHSRSMMVIPHGDQSAISDGLESRSYLLSTCREERLKLIKEKLPEFRPELEVTEWLLLTSAHEKLRDEPLPFGIKGAEKELAEYASKRSNHSNLLWSRRHRNTSAKNCELTMEPKKTCIVVGSSRSMLNSKLGPEINAHDIVIRLDGAKTTPKYAPHVGTETTVRFFRPESAHMLSHEIETWANQTTIHDEDQHEGGNMADFYAMRASKPEDIRWLLLADPKVTPEQRLHEFNKLPFKYKKAPNPGPLSLVFNRIRLLNPELLQEAQHLANLSTNVPSAGLSGIVAALHECQLPVTVTGFMYSPARTGGQVHYYEKLTSSRRHVSPDEHDMDEKERAFIDKLIGMGFVKELLPIKQDQDDP